MFCIGFGAVSNAVPKKTSLVYHELTRPHKDMHAPPMFPSGVRVFVFSQPNRLRVGCEPNSTTITMTMNGVLATYVRARP